MEILQFLRRSLLSLLFITTVITFFFNFVRIRLMSSNVKLTGFDLLKNEDTVSVINAWMIMVFIVGLTGFLVSLFNGRTKYGIGFLLGLAGIILMLLIQFSSIENYAIKDAGTETISFQLAYWVCLTAFALAGSRSYLLQNKSSKKKVLTSSQGAVNINIITQSNKVGEK